jgi:RAB protein geranylgeranyltransferase component A
MEFQPVAGSFVYRGGDVHKVPNTGKDAMNSVSSSLLNNLHSHTPALITTPSFPLSPS